MSRSTASGLFINSDYEKTLCLLWWLYLTKDLANVCLPGSDNDCLFLRCFAADEVDQLDYRMADLPDLALPRCARRPPSLQEAQEIQRLIKRMLAFAPGERPRINEVVAAFQDLADRFPMSWLRQSFVSFVSSLSSFLSFFFLTQSGAWFR